MEPFNTMVSDVIKTHKRPVVVLTSDYQYDKLGVFTCCVYAAADGHGADLMHPMTNAQCYYPSTADGSLPVIDQMREFHKHLIKSITALAESWKDFNPATISMAISRVISDEYFEARKRCNNENP